MKARVILKIARVLASGLWGKLRSDLPVSDFRVSEISTVRSGDSPVSVGHPRELGGSGNLDPLHRLSACLLFDVLNGQLATWGLDCSESV